MILNRDPQPNTRANSQSEWKLRVAQMKLNYWMSRVSVSPKVKFFESETAFAMLRLVVVVVLSLAQLRSFVAHKAICNQI
jgi:hypothetical protein